MQLTEILNYLFGSTTIVSIYIAFKSRKSEIKKAEANALETIQTVYNKFVADAEIKFDSMLAEIKIVKEENFQFQKRVDQLQLEVENIKKVHSLFK